CTGSCGIDPLSQYVSNATDLVEVKVFTQERIPFLMANTHNLNLNRTPSHNFAKFMDAAPFPWNNSYKGNFDDYLFYYSEECFNEQNKMFQNLKSALKRVRTMLIALGFNFQTRNDVFPGEQINLMDNIDDERCCRFWLYCSVT